MALNRKIWTQELRELLSLAIPVVISELGWMVQGMVDTIMVGRLGPSAIGAVALGNAVYYVPSIGGIGLLLGLDTLVSQAFGREDHEACHRWLAQGVYLALFISIPMMLLLWAASYGYALAGIAPELAGPAGSYLRWMNWGTLPLLAYAAVRRYLQGVSQVRAVMWSFLGSNLINWLGNWLLITGRWGCPAMGVEGSALSTVISRILMALSLFVFAWRYERRRGHPLFLHWARPSFGRVRDLIQLGGPAAAQVVLEVGAWNMATFAAGWLTPGALASHQIVLNYASFTYMAPLGISAAASIAVGQAVGAGDLGRARRAGWIALGVAVAFMLVAAVVYLLARVPLTELYTSDPEVLRLAPALLLVVAAFEIFDAVQTVATGALRGLGETRWPMIANLLGYWFLGLPLGLTLCFVLHWGILGLWYGLTVALILIAGMLLDRWRRDSARFRLGRLGS